MRYRNPTIATLALIILTATLAVGCASVQTGADPVLVNAERSLNVATISLDALFKADHQFGATVIDPLIPTWKAAVNDLRLKAPAIIGAANGSIKAYRALLALRRADPTQVTQDQLNQLAADLGTKIVAAVQLGQDAARVTSSWTGGGK